MLHNIEVLGLDTLLVDAYVFVGFNGDLTGVPIYTLQVPLCVIK